MGWNSLGILLLYIIYYIYYGEYQKLSIKKSVKWRVKINFNIISQSFANQYGKKK